MIQAISNSSVTNKVSFGNNNRNDRTSAGRYRTGEDFGRDSFVSNRASGVKMPPRKGFFERIVDTVSDSINQQRAQKFEQKMSDMHQIEDTARTYRDQKRYLNNRTKNSVDNFYSCAELYTRFKDVTSHDNKYYTDPNAPESYTLSSKYGNAKVHLEQAQVKSKYGDYPMDINVPCAVSIGETTDRHGYIESARGFMDFNEGIIFGDLQLAEDGFLADTVHVVKTPKGGKSGFFHKIPIRVGTPFSMYNVYARNNGIVTASEMVVYETDEDNNLVSTRTYINPEIRPLAKNKAEYLKTGDFKITSDMILDSDFHQGRIDSTRFYLNHQERYEGEDFSEEADTLLKMKRNGVAEAYLDYYDDYEESYRAKKTYNL